MNTYQTVHCATTIFLIISLLTEKCYSRNAENNVLFEFKNNVKFVKKLQQPDLTAQPNINVNKYKIPWYIDNPLDILEDKNESTQKASRSSEYLKIEDHDNRRKIFKNRVSRQINNGYSSIYPSLPTFNPNSQNTYPTPYTTPGPQYNTYYYPPPPPYNPSNVNSFNNFANHNRFPQNSTFQASIPSMNYSSRPSYYPYNQNLLPNNFTKPNYIQNNWYNQSSSQNLNHYNLNNNPHNYSLHSNRTNFNSGFPQPSYNQAYGSVGKTNNTNTYNTLNGYNFSSGTRNNPFYNSAQPINGSFNSQPFRPPNFASSNYPSNAVNANIRSNNSWISNYSQNAAFNPYYNPKTQTSNQTYSVNPTYMYNSNYSNYRNPQNYNQNGYYNNPQNNSYFTTNKNPIGGTTVYRPNQNNLLYLNQSYTHTTPISTPFYRPNTIPQNNFGGPNQSYLTEPNHFFYTPGGNNLNSSVNYNLPHKYYK